MAIHNHATKGFIQPSPQVSKSTSVVAPVKGVDARNVLSLPDPLYSIYAFNMTPSYYGLQVRPGYREWAIGLDTGLATSYGVGTIIPVGGNDALSGDDMLFAVTNEGIWDVTVEGATPTLELDFDVPGNGENITSSAGFGVFTSFTTDAGVIITFYADARNGLFQYDSSNPWARTTGITGSGLDLENIAYITSHKGRLWLFERGQSKAWYLAPGAIAGAATEFFFGSKFKHGGELAGLFSWTIDGGTGVDDYFVSVSRSGDVIIYSGNDPADADDWKSTGQWFIGAVPEGNDFGTQQGGNLFLLSIYGLVSLGDLITGVDGKDVTQLTDAVKIAPVIRQAMKAYRTLQGWAVKYVPAVGSLLVAGPKQPNGDLSQYSLSMLNGGWGLWRDAPIKSFDEWKDFVYAGTPDSRVVVFDSALDDVKLTPPVSGRNGYQIAYSILTSYQNYDEPSLFKRGKYIRAQYLAESPPSQTSKFLYDYELNEIINTASLTFNPAAVWDSAIWDASVWGTGLPDGVDKLVGGWGMGRNIAIATRGDADGGTTLVSWDVVWDAGNPI